MESPTVAEKVQSAPEQVERLLPTVEHITDAEIKSGVIEFVSEAAPGYFWVAPATATDHHHPICRERRGLWAHTLMVATVYERLYESYLKQNRITPREMNHGRAAVLVHDMFKYGDGWSQGDASDTGHELLVADRVAAHDALPDAVGDAARSHMGPWYDGPAPETGLQQLVHNCDMVASTGTIDVGIHRPPKELVDRFGERLPTARL